MSHNQGFVSFRAHLKVSLKKKKKENPISQTYLLFSLKECSRPCIPYMGMYLTDLTFIEEGNKDSGDQINFNKRRMVGIGEYLGQYWVVFLIFFSYCFFLHRLAM